MRDSKISRGCAKILEIPEGRGCKFWGPILENPEGRGGHTANPFRGGGGMDIFWNHTLFCFSCTAGRKRHPKTLPVGSRGTGTGLTVPGLCNSMSWVLGWASNGKSARICAGDKRGQRGWAQIRCSSNKKVFRQFYKREQKMVSVFDRKQTCDLMLTQQCDHLIF